MYTHKHQVIEGVGMKVSYYSHIHSHPHRQGQKEQNEQGLFFVNIYNKINHRYTYKIEGCQEKNTSLKVPSGCLFSLLYISRIIFSLLFYSLESPFT